MYLGSQIDNMKKSLLFISIFFYSLFSVSQSVSPTAIVSAGNATTVGGTYVSWSVGETFVSTLSSSTLILTQGFQQPDVLISGCTDPLACNYSPSATQDDGSCILPITPAVTIASSDADNSICAGTSVTFTATATNGGLTPVYQWQLNGGNIGTGGTTITLTSLNNNDIVTVVMTANNDCQTSATANGNSITTTVTNNVTPAVAIASSDADNSICSGTSVTFTATPTNGGTTPAYQWKLNGANVGTNSSTYTSSALATGAVVSVVMTANNACQTSTSANGNNITTTVTESISWYLDADSDGYYVSMQPSCVSPGQGYTNIAGTQGDCDDTSPLINAGSTDICGNGIDEDCSGSDCAIVLGCIDTTACNFNLLANTDDGSCILPQFELCNGLDDNCNGQIDEGLTLGSVNAIPVTSALYPACSGNALKPANLNNGSNSAIIEGDGPDLWYSLNAQFNTLRASLSAAFGDNEIRLYHYTDGCFELLETEHEIYTTSSAATGNQILITDNLTVGENYYIAVHRNSGNSNTSAKICFNHFDGSSCDHFFSNNTGIYNNVCTSFKAQYRGNATNYIFDILSAAQNSVNLNIAPWSYTTNNANSVVPRLGTILPANMTASAKVYTLRVPVIYAIPDAAGNYTSITANSNATCTVTLNPELPIALRASDRCPINKSVASSISIDRTICGAMRYEWEFTQQIPSLQAPVTVLGGLYTTVFFLNNVPGMGNGKTYNVRVRPIHANGEVGVWGTSQCLRTGSSGMMMENNPALDSEFLNVESMTLYPNPSSGQNFTIINPSARAEEEMQLTITDIAGKLVMKKQVFFNGQQLNVECQGLSDGLYMVMIGDQRMRLVVTQ